MKWEVESFSKQIQEVNEKWQNVTKQLETERRESKEKLETERDAAKTKMVITARETHMDCTGLRRVLYYLLCIIVYSQEEYYDYYEKEFQKLKSDEENKRKELEQELRKREEKNVCIRTANIS